MRVLSIQVVGHNHDAQVERGDRRARPAIVRTEGDEDPAVGLEELFEADLGVS
jgi:hypothetical protein